MATHGNSLKQKMIWLALVQKFYNFTSIGTFLTGEGTSWLKFTHKIKQANKILATDNCPYLVFSDLWLRELQVTFFDINVTWTLKIFKTTIRKCAVKIHFTGAQNFQRCNIVLFQLKLLQIKRTDCLVISNVGWKRILKSHRCCETIILPFIQFCLKYFTHTHIYMLYLKGFTEMLHQYYMEHLTT